MKEIFEIIVAGDTKKPQEFLDRESRGTDVASGNSAGKSRAVMLRTVVIMDLVL